VLQKNQQTTAALTCKQILASEEIRGYFNPHIPSHSPTKLIGFASISGTTSAKSGMHITLWRRPCLIVCILNVKTVKYPGVVVNAAKTFKCSLVHICM